MKHNFELPLTQWMSDFLERLGIKEQVLKWKQLRDEIHYELFIDSTNKDSDKIKVI